MKHTKKRLSLSAVVLAGVILVTLAAAVYIMANHLGLSDSLDFGAGAYYYADMPGFEKLVNSSHYTSQTPMWALIALFLLWGAAMYRLWGWIEKGPKNKKDGGKGKQET